MSVDFRIMYDLRFDAVQRTSLFNLLNLVHWNTLKALSFADWLVGLLVYSRFSMAEAVRSWQLASRRFLRVSSSVLFVT